MADLLSQHNEQSSGICKMGMSFSHFEAVKVMPFRSCPSMPSAAVADKGEDRGGRRRLAKADPMGEETKTGTSQP